MGAAPEHMTVGQFPELVGDCLDQLFVAITECGTPQARKAFQVAPSLVVIDINALAAHDIELFDLLEIGNWVYKSSHRSRG